jgi:outer membrane cobalamin receptor
MLAAYLLPDSTNLTTLSLYYSNLFREYRDEENRTNPNGMFIQSDHRTSWFGAVFRQNLDTDFQHFLVGAELGVRQVNTSPNIAEQSKRNFAAYAKEELLFIPQMVLAGFGRYDIISSHHLFSLGADASIHLTQQLSAFGGFSLSHRLPGFEETSWQDSIARGSENLQREKHNFLEVGLRYAGEKISASLTYTRREIFDAIRAEPRLDSIAHLYRPVNFVTVDKQLFQGIEIQTRFSIWKLAVELNATYLLERQNGVEKRRLPTVWGNGGVYFRDILFDNHLDVKVGFKGRFLTAQTGEEYFPEAMVFSDRAGAEVGPYASVDFVLIGKVGDAYVHLIWENLFNQNYVLTSMYPMLDRNVRFGISWQLLD